MPRTRRGTSDLTRWITHISADVDIAGPGHKPPPGTVLPDMEQAVELIDATLPPSAIIASGGGLYPIYRLTEPFEIACKADAERFRNVGRRLDRAVASHGFHVDATALDLSRVIRPPGVVNHKPGRDPRPVTVHRGWLAGAGDFTIDQIEATLPSLPVKVVTPKADYTGPTTGRAPWDIFAERYDVDDVLAADTTHEWEDVGTRGGMRAWRYVGSSHDYSIKQAPDTGTIIVWSGTIAAALDIEPGDGLDLWGFACRLVKRDPTLAAKKAGWT